MCKSITKILQTLYISLIDQQDTHVFRVGCYVYDNRKSCPGS